MTQVKVQKDFGERMFKAFPEFIREEGSRLCNDCGCFTKSVFLPWSGSKSKWRVLFKCKGCGKYFLLKRGL